MASSAQDQAEFFEMLPWAANPTQAGSSQPAAGGGAAAGGDDDSSAPSTPITSLQSTVSAPYSTPPSTPPSLVGPPPIHTPAPQRRRDKCWRCCLWVLNPVILTFGLWVILIVGWCGDIALCSSVFADDEAAANVNVLGSALRAGSASSMAPLGVVALAAAVDAASASEYCAAFGRAVVSESSTLELRGATYYRPGEFNVSGSEGWIENERAFCRVQGIVWYGEDGKHRLGFEVWFPDADVNADAGAEDDDEGMEGWNGRFLAVGNSGLAGFINTADMLDHFNSYLFAIAGGDSGHLASLNNNGTGEPGVYLPFLHSPAELHAWIHDSIALFTPPAKALTTAYYTNYPSANRSRVPTAPEYSYFHGCSTGGAQGFALAERYPDLFDGIVAASPGNWYSHLALSFLWNAQATAAADAYLPPTTLQWIQDTVIARCGGGIDGVLENPLACTVNTSTLACPSTGPAPKHCLTPPQLTALNAIYTGPLNGTIYPGFAPGSETSWTQQEGLPPSLRPLATLFTLPLLQNLVYNNLSYPAAAFTWQPPHLAAVEALASPAIDAIAPDLSAFARRGRRLLVLQGWADPYNAPAWPLRHLARLRRAMGVDPASFVRLFMLPGGGHCGKAPGFPRVPARVQMLEALVAWVERGEAPEWVVARDEDGKVEARKVCMWPMVGRKVREGGGVGDWECVEG